MSVIRKYPYIEGVIDGLSKAQKESLLQIMNTPGNNVNADFKNMPQKGVTPVYFKLDETNFKTGILIYTDAGCTLIAYHRFQDVLLLKLDVASATYERINEYCDINELRRILTVGDEVTAGEINSGNAEENMVLAADGAGGAEWKDTLDTITPETVESGDAVQLFGFDAQGNLVKDDMPEGIVVDDSVIEDSTNAVAGGAVYDELQNHYTKTETDALLETKANVDGNYPTMTVGVADNLSPYDKTSGTNQHAPFNFQASGTNNGSDPTTAVGAIALMKEKRGNTVVVNQLAGPVNILYYVFGSATGSISDGVASFTANAQYGGMQGGVNVINGHKYFIACNIKTTGGANINLNLYWLSASARASSSTNWQYICTIGTLSGADQASASFRILDTRTSDWDEIQVKDMTCIDLTQWFNGDIPQDLLDNPSNFFRYYQGSLAYNEGTLVNANSRYLKAIGRNQWDEEWQQGYYYDTTTGEKGSTSYWSCSKNYQSCISNTTYYFYKTEFVTDGTRVYFYDINKNYIGYEGLVSNGTFTTPSNCCYFTFAVATNSTYNHDVTISIYYTGEGGYDQYYPYELLTNNDTGTETLRSAGSVADSKALDGTITRQVGSVDLGTLSWSYENSLGVWYASLSNLKNFYEATAEKYIPKDLNASAIDVGEISTYWGWFGGMPTVIVKNGSSTTQPSGLLHYELETPTTEQGTPYSENVVIDDFGSMDFSGTSGVPQGNVLFYPVDYKAFIDTLHNDTDGDPDNLALKSDLAVVDNKIGVKVPECPTTTDGTYVLKATVSDGEVVYTWESEA